MRVKDGVAVVTGGGSGIGAACCRRLAAEGARVAVLDRTGEAAEKIAAEIGGLALTADVADEGAVAAAIQKVADRFGPINILVNNAGVAVRKPVHELAEEDWTRVLDVNAKGAYLCSKHALRFWHESGGSIIHMSSVTGLTGVRNRGAYAAAKGALIALARTMAIEYAPRNIRVNCVCPGFVRTPFIARLLASKETAERLRLAHPLGRLGEPEDIANAVLFLASSESSWITGQCLAVDGGFTAGHTEDI